MPSKPTVPTQVFDYTGHTTNNPTQPHPGVSLDASFASHRAFAQETFDFLDHFFDDEGDPRSGIIKSEHVDLSGLEAALQPSVDAAQAEADRSAGEADAALSQANAAASSASGAAASATQAASHLTQVQNDANLAGIRANDALTAANRAETAETNASNARNGAQTAEANATNSEFLSFRWAEYLSGPVRKLLPDEEYPHAVDDGLWSAKWWAIRAQNLIGPWAYFYLGGQPNPPAVTADGSALLAGMLYFNTSNQTMYVFDGVNWRTFDKPAPTASQALVYRVVAMGLTFTFGSVPDLNSNTLSLDPIDTEPLLVYLNGALLTPPTSTETGDYTVDAGANEITITDGAEEDDIVHILVLADPDPTAGSALQANKLRDVDIDPTTGLPGYVDGVRDTFKIRDLADNPITPTSAEEIQYSWDGVMLEPGADFTVSGDEITFAEAPPIDTYLWGMSYAP